MDYSITFFPEISMPMHGLHELDVNDRHHQCAIIAGSILGVECCDTVMSGDPAMGDDKGQTFYQITPDAYKSTRPDEIEAFNNYFYKNYGIWIDRCYFKTPEDAFFNLLKAWAIWNKRLPASEKEQYQ